MAERCEIATKALHRKCVSTYPSSHLPVGASAVQCLFQITYRTALDWRRRWVLWEWGWEKWVRRTRNGEPGIRRQRCAHLQEVTVPETDMRVDKGYSSLSVRATLLAVGHFYMKVTISSHNNRALMATLRETLWGGGPDTGSSNWRPPIMGGGRRLSGVHLGGLRGSSVIKWRLWYHHILHTLAWTSKQCTGTEFQLGAMSVLLVCGGWGGHPWML